MPPLQITVKRTEPSHGLEDSALQAWPPAPKGDVLAGAGRREQIGNGERALGERECAMRLLMAWMFWGDPNRETTHEKPF